MAGRFLHTFHPICDCMYRRQVPSTPACTASRYSFIRIFLRTCDNKMHRSYNVLSSAGLEACVLLFPAAEDGWLLLPPAYAKDEKNVGRGQMLEMFIGEL